jgi:transcriptional regulator with XRE-family HTH domain
MLNIGHRIRAARKGAGISQEDLSKLIKVNRSYLSLVENGESSPTFGFLEKVARGLNIEVEDLILGMDTSAYFTTLPDNSTVYDGLAAFLDDREQVLMMNPTDAEIEILKQIRVSPTYKPTKHFFVQALLDYRKSRAGS